MQKVRTQFVAGWMIAACCALGGCGQPAHDAPAAVVAPKAAESASEDAKPAATEGWGKLSGRFIVAGAFPAPAKIAIMGKDVAVCGKHKLVDESVVVDEAGGLANVLVWLRSKDLAVNPEYQKTAGEAIVLDNKNCRFAPHVVTMRTSQKLELRNSDPIGHNTNFGMIANPAANPTVPPGILMTYEFPDAETLPCKVQCSIHPWMSAWLLVRPNPYMAISAKDGKFELKDLPVGELEFQVWQEKIGYVNKVNVGGADPEWKKGRFKKTIKPGNNDLGDIVIAAVAFNK